MQDNKHADIMIIIKGNLTIDKSGIESIQSLQPNATNPGQIITYATLDDYDTTDAIVIDSDVIVSDYPKDELILVTGEVVFKEGGNE